MSSSMTESSCATLMSFRTTIRRRWQAILRPAVTYRRAAKTTRKASRPMKDRACKFGERGGHDAGVSGDRTGAQAPRCAALPPRGPRRSPMTAHIVGGGFGGLAAAALLIRNAGVSGADITIYEADEQLGGGVFLGGRAERGNRLRDSVFTVVLACTS